MNQVACVGATKLSELRTTNSSSADTNSSILKYFMLRYWLGQAAAALAPIYAFFAVSGGAIPNFIEIGDGESVTIDVGLINTETGEFDTDPEMSLPFYVNARFLNFDVEQYPGNTTEGSWYVTFHPKSVQLFQGDTRPKKTQMTISFTAPSNPKETIQSGVLRIYIQDMQVMGNMWVPWGRPLGNMSVNFSRFKGIGGKASWLFGAIFAGFGKYSGTVDSETGSYVDILVKVKPYHKIRFDAVPLKQIKPGEITSIPIKIQNLGNYKDTFGFRIISNKGNNTSSDPLSISLQPGEEKNTYLSLAIPPNILDTGTVQSIKIQTYSIDQPNITIAEQSIFIETRGIYISELGGAAALLILLIIIILVAVIIYRRRKIYAKMDKKPEKPWDKPEKQQELKQLKKEDRNRYNQVISQMEKEYISSLAAYKSYKKSYITEQKKKSRKRITSLFRKSDRQKKTKQQKKTQQPTKKTETNQIKKSGFQISSFFKERKKEPEINKPKDLEKQQKEQVMNSIQKEQNKQRKLLRK